MASDYLGRYGAALRQLTALQQQPLPSAIQPGAPVPGGAFDAVTPNPAMDPMSPENMKPATPAFDQVEGKPLSAKQLYTDMPDEHKAALEKQIDDSGIDVNMQFGRAIATGILPAPEKPKEMSKRDKIGYLAEVALRTISNMSRPGTSSGADWADATLQTDTRRGAIESVERERELSAAERRRLEQREDTKTAHTEGREDTTTRTAQQRADAKESRERAEHVADKQQEAELEKQKIAREKSANRKTIIGDDGQIYTLGDNADATAVTTTKTKKVRRGTRGKGRDVDVSEKVPVKATLKTDASGIDQDRLISAINTRVAEMKKDTKLLREMRKAGISDIDGEIATRARAQVMADLGVVKGNSPSAAPNVEAAQLSDEDRALIDKWSKAAE